MTTLEEVDRHWSLTDLADAHEALDIKAEIEQYYIEQNKAKSGGGR